MKKDTDYTISVKNINASDLSNVTVDIKINGIGNYKNSVQNTENVSLQTYTISGTVTDSNNNPLSGVSIILKSEEESIGNVSISANGTYIISNVPYGTIGTITAEKLGYKESTIDLTQSDYPVDANDGFTFVKDIGLTADTYTIYYNNNSGS